MELKTQIEILKKFYEALNQNKPSEALQLFDPQLTRVEWPGTPAESILHGHAAMLDHLVAGRSTWAEGACQIEGFIPAGENRVVVLVHVHVRLKDRTDWIDGRLSDIYTFRGNKIIEMRSIANTHEALLWAGVAQSVK